MLLADILGPIFGLKERPLREEDSPETLAGWDSIKQIEVVVALEDAYGIALSTAEIIRLKSIRDILRVLRERGFAVRLS